MTPQIIAGPGNGLTATAREVLASLLKFLQQLGERVRDFNRRIEAVFR